MQHHPTGRTARCPQAVFVAAAGDSGGLWSHLFETVLPRYVANSLILMVGVGCVALLFGVSTAWIVTMYEFPARRYVEWMLLLPAAVPAYLVAYTDAGKRRIPRARCA